MYSRTTMCVRERNEERTRNRREKKRGLLNTPILLANQRDSSGQKDKREQQKKDEWEERAGRKDP